MFFICYAFIIVSKYEEKKCVNIKFVLNHIIIYGLDPGCSLEIPCGFILFSYSRRGFRNPEENREKAEIDVYNQGPLW